MQSFMHQAKFENMKAVFEEAGGRLLDLQGRGEVNPTED